MRLARPRFPRLFRFRQATGLALACSLAVASAAGLTRLDLARTELSPAFAQQTPAYAAALDSDVASASAFVTPDDAATRLFLKPANSTPWQHVARGATVVAGDQHALVLRIDGQVLAWGDNTHGQTTVPTAAQSGTTALAAGHSHSLALLENGSVLAWGNDTYGQSAVPSAALSGIVAIAAGGDQSFALTTAGAVLAWGQGTAANSLPPSVSSGIVAIAAADNHAVALTATGSVITWGNSPPSPSAAASGVIAIYAGYNRTLALKRDGTVLAWGYGPTELVTVPASAQGAVGLAIGQDHNFALRADGSVYAWDASAPGPLDPPADTASEVVAISAGRDHALALKRDGSLVTWGTTGFGLSTPPLAALNSLRLPASAALPLAYGTSRLGLRTAAVQTPTTAPVPLASLRNRTLSVNPNRVYAIRTDGSVYTWGGETPPPSVGGLTAISFTGTYPIGIKPDGSLATWYAPSSFAVPSDATDLIGISAYASNYLALRRDGRVVAWGTVSASFLTLPSTAQSGVVAIAAGTIFNLALRAEGSVISWGTTDTAYAPPSAAGTGVVAIAISAQNALALKSDGSLLVWGNPTTAIATQIPAADATDLISVSASPGATHALALRSDGRVIAWGSNTNGQTTVPVAAQSDVVAICAGSNASFALKSDGTLVSWGSPSSIPTTATSGLLVPPASSSISITSPVDQLAPRVPLAAGDGFHVALRDTGTPVAWGSVTTANTPPPNTSALVALTARDGFTLALRSDGTVTGWGTAFNGQLTIPSTASSVVALAAGNTHALALKRDGSVIAWGNGSSGQTTVPNLNPAPTTADGYVFTAIAAADSTSFGLRSDGRVIAWGSSIYNLTTVPAAAQSDVVAIAAGYRHALALKRDGSVVGWGENSYGQAQALAPSKPVTAIAAGLDFSLYLCADGTVGGIGPNGFFVPATATGVVAVAAGRYQAAALRSDGSVITWGGGVTYTTPSPLSVLRPGPPGDDYQVSITRAYPSPDLAALSLSSGALTPAFSPTTTAYTQTTPATPGTIGLEPTPATAGATVQIRINGYAPRTLLTGPTFALASNNSDLLGLTETGGFTSTQTSFASSANIPAAARQDLVSLLSFQNLAIGLTRAGGLVAWTPGSATPVTIPAELTSGLRQIVATDTDILALRTDGTVLAWTHGNTTLDTVPFFAQSGVVRLSARNGTRLALLADGSVKSWGNLSQPPPEAASAVVSIFAGDGLAFAQKSDGTLLLWGNHHAALAAIPAAAQTGVTDLVADYFSAQALLADGSVISWGDPALTTVAPPSAASTGVVALAAQGPVRAVQKSNGTVVSWDIGSSSLPRITPLPLATPRSARFPLRFGENRVSLRVTPLDRALSDAPLATGYNFHLAVTPQGSVTYRPSSTFSSSIIIPTEAQSNVTSVFTGGYGTYALTTAGRVVTLSGSSISPGLQPSTFGQTPVVAPITSLAVGQSFALLLRTDGTLAAVGSPPGGPLPAVNDAVAITAGTYHALILRANGQVLALGNNTAAPVPAAAQSGVIAIAAATDRSLALKSDGSVVTWDNTLTIPTPTEALSGVVGIALNDTQAFALKADGSVIAWGSDTAAYPPPASVSSGVIALFASGRHQVALKADGSTVTWGRHITSGTLYPADFGGPLLTALVRDYHLTITRDFPPPALDQLAASGGLLAPGFTPATLAYALPATPYPALALNGFSRAPGDELAIRTGPAAFAPRLRGPTLPTTSDGILALTPDGTLQHFGSSPGNFTPTPTGLTGIAVTESYAVIALKNDGSLTGFGNNAFNLLSALPGGTDFVALATGRSHALAVRRDGSVAAWGGSSAQKLTIPATATEVVAVAGGDYTSIALRRDGTAVAWGRYSSLPQSIPDDAQSGLIAVAAGRDHYLVLRADGRAVQFGNTSGMSDVPPYRFVAIGASDNQNLGLRPNGELVSWGGYGPAPQLTPANSTGIASFVFGPNFIAAQRLDGSLISIPSSSPGPSNLNGSPAFAGPFALPLNALQPLALGVNSVEVRVSRPGSNHPAATYTVSVTRQPAPGFSLFPGTSAAPATSLAYSHNFGLHRVTTPSPAQTFTLLNTGTADLVVSAASLLGSQSSDFAVSGLLLPLTLAPGATTNFTATTTPSAIGNRLAVLGFTTNLPNDEPAGFTFRAEGISFAYDYDYWRSTQFLTTDLSDPDGEATVWGELADPDQDGIPNLLEYATGTDAKITNANPTPVALDPDAPGGPLLALTYQRRIRAAVSGMLFQVEWSDTLAPGSWSNFGVTEIVTSTFGFNETVRASVPLGPTARFLRLRVTAP